MKLRILRDVHNHKKGEVKDKNTDRRYDLKSQRRDRYDVKQSKYPGDADDHCGKTGPTDCGSIGYLSVLKKNMIVIVLHNYVSLR